jgi:hypothetical protein
MAVMAREAWTDERLDDLKVRVERGFDEVKGEVREVRGEIRELRAETKIGFESMHRTMFIGFVTLFASIAASVIGGIIAALTFA